MLSPAPLPGLFITATDTGVGKTLVAGAIADWFQRQGRRVAVSKPVATGCVRRREGLVSEDAEFLAHCADARAPLDLICPQRYREPLAPAIAADRARQPVDWESIDRSIRLVCQDAEVLIVEGAGGLMVPMDKKHVLIDVVEWLGLPAVIVARAGLGTINHTLLSVEALRRRKIPVAGVVINRYPADQTPVAEETNPRAIEQWGKVPVLSIVPEDRVARIGEALAPPLPENVTAAINLVDWSKFLTTE